MLYHSKSILKNLQYTSDNSAFHPLTRIRSIRVQGEVGVDGWSHIMNVVLVVSITSPVAPDAHIKHDHELSVL